MKLNYHYKQPYICIDIFTDEINFMVDYVLEITLKHSDIDWLWSNVTSASLANSKRLTLDQHIFVDLHIHAKAETRDLFFHNEVPEVNTMARNVESCFR